MQNETWWIWMILGAIFLVGEIFTAGFFIFWFGIAAVVAGIFALIGLNAYWQWGSFILVSGILVAVSRQFADRFTKKQPPGVGANRLIDRNGMVLEEINNHKGNGKVRLDKEEWRAESENGEVITRGKRVRVVRIEGTRLIVNQISEE